MNKSIKRLAESKADKKYGGEDRADYRRNNRALNRREAKTQGLATVASYQGDATQGRFYVDKNAPVVPIPKNAKIGDTFDGQKMYGDVHRFPSINGWKGGFERSFYDDSLMERSTRFKEARRKGTMRGPSLGK